jgi:hypothetical protein
LGRIKIDAVIPSMVPRPTSLVSLLEMIILDQIEPDIST